MASAAPELPVLARDQAFETLYRRYLKDVYHYSLALLRNPADAEDVTQTTFMNAYRALQRGEQVEKPQNWLIKIAHNAARSRYARATRRVKEVPLEDHLEQLAVPEEEKPDIQAVLDALGRLPLNQRAALVMRELEGRTYAEIAETLDVSVSAVETLLFRARRSLRLKASAIRALAVIPVPSSLTQLFDAGSTALMGGGAIIGTGFLVKAAVAVVAGVVATGVGGDNARRAAVAARPAAVAMATGSERRLDTNRLANAFIVGVRKASVRAVRVPRVDGGIAVSHRTHRPDGDATSAGSAARDSDASSSAAGSTPAAASSPAQSTAPAAATTTTATATTAAATSTVSSAVQDATSTVQSAVPAVTVPAVPPPPVAVPPPPPLPKLP